MTLRLVAVRLQLRGLDTSYSKNRGISGERGDEYSDKNGGM